MTGVPVELRDEDLLKTDIDGANDLRAPTAHVVVGPLPIAEGRRPHEVQGGLAHGQGSFLPSLSRARGGATSPEHLVAIASLEGAPARRSDKTSWPAIRRAHCLEPLAEVSLVRRGIAQCTGADEDGVGACAGLCLARARPRLRLRAALGSVTEKRSRGRRCYHAVGTRLGEAVVQARNAVIARRIEVRGEASMNPEWDGEVVGKSLQTGDAVGRALEKCAARRGIRPRRARRGDVLEVRRRARRYVRWRLGLQRDGTAGVDGGAGGLFARARAWGYG